MLVFALSWVCGLHTGFNEGAAAPQAFAVFDPDAFVNSIAEVSGFFGENGAAAFGAFVFFKLAVFFNHLCVVHADEGVFAVAAIDDDLGEDGVVAFEDVGPKQVFFVVGWLHAFVDAGVHGPAVAFEALDGLFVVGFAFGCVGLAVVAIAVAEVDDAFVLVVLVVVAKLIYQFVDHNAGYFVGFDEKLVDDAIYGFHKAGNEVVVAFLADAEQSDFGAPVWHNFDGFAGVAIEVETAVGFFELGKIVIGLCGYEADKFIVLGVIIHMAVAFDGVVVVFDTVDDPVEDFDHEGEQGLLVVFANDVGHAEVLDVVEGIGEGEQHTRFAHEGRYLVSEADGFVPDVAEKAFVFLLVGRDEFELQLDDTVPYFEQADVLFGFVVVGIFEQPFLFGHVGHGAHIAEAVVLNDGLAASDAEVFLVATVGGGCFLVVAFLVDGEGFVHNFAVNIRTTGAAHPFLTEQEEARAIAETDEVVVFEHGFVRREEVFGRFLPDHIMAALFGFVAFEANLFEVFEGGRQRSGEQLPVGLSGDAGDAAGHGAVNGVHFFAHDEAFACATSPHIHLRTRIAHGGNHLRHIEWDAFADHDFMISSASTSVISCALNSTLLSSRRLSGGSCLSRL